MPYVRHRPSCNHVGGVYGVLGPPLRRAGRETGLVAGWRQCTVCLGQAVTAQTLPPHGVLHRVYKYLYVGAVQVPVAQLPGP